MYYHLSPYNYKQNDHFWKDTFDFGRNRIKPTTAQKQFYSFKFFHERCASVIFHTNISSHLLLEAVFVLRKLQVFAAQLHNLKDCINTQDDKLKMCTSMEMTGIFAKERLSQENKENFLKYRSIQCSKFPILPHDQGPADLIRLKEQLINMERTSKLVDQYFLQVRRTIRASKDIAKTIADSRVSLYGPECEKEALIYKINEFYKASFASIPQFYEAKWEEIYGKTQIYEAYLKSPRNLQRIA